MLSAEHYALEHRAIQALLDIRQREVDYMTQRFGSIGTQSALIGGFVVSALTGIQPGGDENTLTGVKQAFWATSALSLACSVHCILNSTFVAVWGPGLALRGPTGSVSRAYHSMVSERKHIMIAYVLSLFFFVVQTVMGFFILDAKPGWSMSAILAAVVMISGLCYSGFTLYRMSDRFFFTDHKISMGREMDGSEQFDPDQLAQNVLERSDSNVSEFAYLQIGENSIEESLLNDTLNSSILASSEHSEMKSIVGGVGGGGETKLSDVKKAAPSPSLPSSLSNPMFGKRFVHMGYLEKRSKLLGRWQKRFVRLQGTTLFFFDDRNAFDKYIATPKVDRKKPKSLSLRGYQILVQNGSSMSKDSLREYCFVLDAMDDGMNKRDRFFRCESEQSLRGWLESLVAASLVAQ